MNTGQEIRVMIFEDNPVMLDAYRSILNGSEGYNCIGSFVSCNGWKQKIEKEHPDVVLMDIEMAEIDGITATRLIKQTFPQQKILIQTVFEDEAKIFEAICAGASGYILKNTSPVKMLEAINDVQKGGVAFTPAVASKVVALFQKVVTPISVNNSYQLTEREKQVLLLLTEGLSMPKIAERIFLSYHTIRDHVKSIYQKLHVASGTEAVAKALKEKLV